MKHSQQIKKTILACLFVTPLLTFNLHAQTGVTWGPPTTDPALWSDPANWGGTVPVSGYKAFFNGDIPSHTAPCIVDGVAGGCQISLGDGSGPCFIVVTNGGNLSAGDEAFGSLDNNGWTGLGTSAAGTITVENGGNLKFAYHAWIGSLNTPASGTLIMNGGTASVTNNGNANWALGTGTGPTPSLIQMNGGTLYLGKYDTGRIATNGSKINVAGGTIIITGGDRTGNVNADHTAGLITAYGGTGTLVVDYNTVNPGMTTVTAIPGVGPPPRQKIVSISVSGGNVTIVYETTLGATYHVESTSSVSPTSWSTVVGSTAVGTGSPVTFTTPQSGNAQFYRSVSP